MKLVNLKILALLVVSYSLALVTLTPVAWMLPVFETRLQNTGITLIHADGNTWQGQVLVNHPSMGYLTVGWQTNPAMFLLGKVPTQISLTNKAMDISGEVVLSPFSVSIVGLEGYADEAAFENIYQSYGSQLSGRLQLDDINLQMTWGKTLKAAWGDLTWSGGPISVPVGRNVQSYQVPMMIGELSSDESQWLVNITSGDQEQYIQASLTQEGTATLSVKRALVNDMNIPLPGSGNSLFEMSQQVF